MVQEGEEEEKLGFNPSSATCSSWPWSSYWTCQSPIVFICKWDEDGLFTGWLRTCNSPVKRWHRWSLRGEGSIKQLGGLYSPTPSSPPTSQVFKILSLGIPAGWAAGERRMGNVPTCHKGRDHEAKRTKSHCHHSLTPAVNIMWKRKHFYGQRLAYKPQSPQRADAQLWGCPC